MFSAAWLLLDNWLLSPVFGGTDIFYFKDPGINWAEGLGFVSRFTFGNPTFDYQVYSQYPPLYPLLFGFFVKLFGVSAMSSQIFNSLINLFVGLVGFAALRPAFAAKSVGASAFALAIVFAISIVFGFFEPGPDRPDGLAVSLGLVALILVRGETTKRRTAVAGMICAVIFFISPYVAIWTATIAAIVIAAQMRSLGDFVVLGLYAAGGAAAMGVATLILITLLLPGWLSAFIGVFTGATTKNETGGGYFLLLLQGDVKGWAAGFPNGSLLYFNVGKLVIAQLALACALLWDGLKPASGRFQGWWIVALLVVSPICVVLMPYQANYARLSAVMLLAAAASATLSMPGPSRRVYGAAIVAGFIGLSLITAPDLIRDLLIRAQTNPSLARANAYIAANKAKFDAPGQLFAVSPQSYMLWRQNGLRPLIAAYSGFMEPQNRARLSHIALGYTGSGDPLAAQATYWPMPEFVLAYQPALPQVPRFLGVPLAHSSQTWEPAIYVRHPEP